MEGKVKALMETFEGLSTDMFAFKDSRHQDALFPDCPDAIESLLMSPSFPLFPSQPLVSPTGLYFKIQYLDTTLLHY